MPKKRSYFKFSESKHNWLCSFSWKRLSFVYVTHETGMITCRKCGQIKDASKFFRKINYMALLLCIFVGRYHNIPFFWNCFCSFFCVSFPGDHLYDFMAAGHIISKIPLPITPFIGCHIIVALLVYQLLLWREFFGLWNPSLSTYFEHQRSWRRQLELRKVRSVFVAR